MWRWVHGCASKLGMLLLIPPVLAESCLSMQMQANMAIRMDCTPPSGCSPTCLATLQTLYSLPNQVKFWDLCMPTEELALEYRARILQLQNEKRRDCGVDVEFPLLPRSSTTTLPTSTSKLVIPTQQHVSAASIPSLLSAIWITIIYSW
jgi:hypothetical protein